VYAALDAIALVIKPPLGPVTARIQATFDALAPCVQSIVATLAALIESFVGPPATICGLGLVGCECGHRQQREQARGDDAGGCLHVSLLEAPGVLGGLDVGINAPASRRLTDRYL
jgi:hypothetical protein